MTTVPETSPLRFPSFHFRVTEEWVAKQKLEHHTVPEGITIVSEDPTPKELRLTRDQLAAIRTRLEAKSKRGAVEHNNPTPESNNMYLQNVALLTPDFVLKEIENVKFMIQNKADEGLVVHAANGDQRTSSLQTYLSWLQERAASDTDDGTYTPADILKTANSVG